MKNVTAKKTVVAGRLARIVRVVTKVRVVTARARNLTNVLVEAIVVVGGKRIIRMPI